MNFEDFADMNEAFLSRTPTQMLKTIDETNFAGNEKLVLNFWGKTYPNSGVGEKVLLKLVADYWDIEDFILEDMIEDTGSLAQAIAEWENSFPEEVTYLEEVESCLYAGSREEVMEQYMTLFPNLTSNGRKWLTAFVLKETRNGTDSVLVKKSIAKMYGFTSSEVKKASTCLSLAELIDQAIDTGCLDVVPTAGKFMTPMLAKDIRKVKGGMNITSRHWCDYKYDGIRAQIHYDGNAITIFNRRGDDITSKYQRDLIPIIDAASDPVDWIVDGEIYPIDANGEPASFSNMGSRIHGKTDEVIYRNPVTIRLFDCLMYGGQPVFEDDLDTRLETLKMHFGEELIAETKEVNNLEEMKEYYEEAISAGFEGIILKNPTATYDFGARSKNWLKYKPPMVDMDCLVTGAVLGKGKRAGVYGSYQIAIRDGDNLVHFGNVGSGFTDADLTFLTEKFNQSTASSLTNEPTPMIIEVKGDMITKNEQGEYGLRFPRYVKYRDDKSEPTQLKEVIE